MHDDREQAPHHAPLLGLSVVELDTDIPAQFAGRLLCEMGADVTLVEPADGSIVRRHLPRSDAGDRRSYAFEYLNGGKRSVRLAPGASRADLAAAAAGADVLLVGPARWRELGRSAAAKVVVVSSLYGESSDECRSQAPSTAFTRYHAGGDGNFLPTSMDPTLRPTTPGYHIGDHMTGVGIVNAALHALHRPQDGPGARFVDFSEQAYQVTLNKMFVSQSSFYRVPLDRFTHTYPFGGNLRCSDGHIAMLVLEGHQWQGLCRMVGEPQWLDDPRFADGVLRRRNGTKIDEVVKVWCAARTTAAVIAAGRTHDVPIGLVATPLDVLADPGLRQRGFLRARATGVGTLATAGLPFGPDFAVARHPTIAPELGDTALPAPPGAGPDLSGPGPSAACANPATPVDLSRLKVLDLTWAGAGPIITWTLAAMGAEVAKVEHPSRPDLLRRANRTYGWKDDDDLDGSPAFNEMNAGKESVVIDLRTAGGRALALELAAKADVVCESMRPGRAEAVGLGYDDVRVVNPSVVYCSLSATGRGTGRPTDVPGYAPIFWAQGGGAWLSGWPQAAPDYVRSPVDMHAGLLACGGVLAALHARGRTGKGAHIDLSAIEAVSVTLGHVLLAVADGQPEPSRRGNDPDGPSHVNDVFPTEGDKRWIALSLPAAQDPTALGEELGLAEGWHTLPAEERWAAVAERTVTRDGRALERRLQKAGVPASRVNTLLDLLDDDGLLSRGYWSDVEHPVIGVQRLSGLPWRLEGVEPAEHGRAPLLDEHTDAVLAQWLGMGPEQVAALRADGSVGGAQSGAAAVSP